ncbi:hypothetical protein BH18ACI1_BH18ACI1_03390 [soil metagenome]
MKECSVCRHCYDDSYNFCPLDDKPLNTSLECNVIISGRYLLEQRLGKGGMGIVYKAKHKFLKSSHAIKVILPSLVDDDESLLIRFKQEAVLAASINHPNVIRVTDFGVENDVMPYLVMEFVDGTPLSVFFGNDQILSVERAFELFQPIALGVAEAHSKGIVHRDLKPQNIMVEKGLPVRKAIKVLDFGLAKIKSTESFSSLVQAQTLSVIGSPPYMSPEQWENNKIDHRTDIYSLGVILYQMMTGNLPFQGDSVPSVMYQHFTASPPTFSSFGLSISSHIEAVVAKALEKDREARYNSVEDMLDDFEKALSKSASSLPVSTQTEFSPQTKSAPTREDEDKSSTISGGNTLPLSNTQKERLYTYFESKGKPNLLADEQLAQEFLQAQDRAEEAKVKVSEADRLVQELAEAQKIAQNAQEKALEAKQKIEAEVRRRVETEMENKLAAEQQARQKAEAERLAQEAEARQKAEDRANYLAQAALEAQQLAEAERKKAEKEAHQRELEESVRRRAEVAAVQLAEQFADAKKKYEEAKQQAEREAELRLAADDKRQKIEGELQAFAESETERRRLAEGEAQKQIQAQASRYEKEAIAAQQRVEEARRLAELEVQKREQAEAAKQLAEEEARRLAKEMLEVQRHIEEIKLHTTKDTQDRISNSSGSHRSGHSTSEENFGAGESNSNLKNRAAPLFQSNFDIANETSEIQTSVQSHENFGGLLNTAPITKSKISIPLMIVSALVVFSIITFGGYGIYYFTVGNSENTESSNVNNNTNAPTDNPAIPPSETKREMVLIQGGKFLMGRSDVVPDDLYWGDQYPAHPVPVNSFYIDKTETSNEDYAKFVQEKNYPPPQNWTNGKPPAGQEKYPVTSVSMSDANAYAEWFSKSKNKICRLPAEEEWEFAARNGAQQTAFPWGNKWDASLANIPPKKVAEVGNSSDETLVGGIKDMMGNVLELTSSKYVLYPGHPGEIDKKLKLFVVRGSSSGESSDRLKKAEWLLTSRQSVTADNASPYMGFRLVCQP